VQWAAWCALLVGGAAGEVHRPLPHQLPAWAAADLERQPAALRGHIRYLSLWALPAKDRPLAWRVLSTHLNGLSRQPDLVPALVLEGTEEALARVNLKDYGIDPAVWDRLADPHVWVKGYFEGSHWHDRGRYYPAPWLIRTRAAYDAYYRLREHMGNPITEGTWFLWQTAVQDDRGQEGYYQFLGVKDRASWEQLVRFDAKLAAQLEQRRVVIFSGITQEPRRLERTSTVLGGLWRTFDSAKAVGEQNVIRLLDDQDFKHDVEEAFAPLPNGLPAFLLCTADGKLAAKAPDNVVRGDHTGASRDTRLHVNLSCWRCHAAGVAENMVKDIEAAPLRQIRSGDYDQLARLRRLYLRNVRPLVQRDRLAYTEAVREASGGWTVQEYAQQLQRLYAWYDGAQVDATWLGRVLGYPGEEVTEKFRSYDRRTRYLDPVLSVLAGDGAVPIRQAEEVFQVAFETIRGEGKR
jgi:hypothetical protein